MRHVVRMVLIAVLSTLGFAVGPAQPAGAAPPEPFAVAGTISRLNPSLIRSEINIPNSGFVVSSLTSNSSNLDHRVANFGRVAVRITPLTTCRVFNTTSGGYVTRPCDTALMLGRQAWAYGSMVPLPTQVSVDEAVADQVVIGAQPQQARMEADVAGERSLGPDFTGQRIAIDYELFTSFLGTDYENVVWSLDDGAGNTLFGGGDDACDPPSCPYNPDDTPVLLSILGGTGRFAGASGTGIFDPAATRLDDVFVFVHPVFDYFRFDITLPA